MRGNLIELAVAFIMAAAFGAVVTAFTDVVMNLIGMVIGTPNFDELAIGSLVIGPFITALVNFVLIALVVYLAIVKPYNAYNERQKEEEVEEEAGPTTEELLTEIRDALRR